MTCVAAWLQTALGADDRRRMVVMDESWRMSSHLAIAACMQQFFKPSRASGDDARAGDGPVVRPGFGRRGRLLFRSCSPKGPWPILKPG
jgi:hypothetical protein